MRRLLSIVMLGILGGCSANSLTPIPRGEVCHSSNDCEGEQICRYDVCVVPDAMARKIGFQLYPTNSSSFRPQVVAPADIDFNEHVTIALLPSIRVEGKLLFRGLDGRLSASGPPGVLTFRRKDAAFAVAPTQTTIGNDLGYSLLLLPGTYTVSFKADDPDVPTKVWAAREFLLDTNPELSIAQEPFRLQGSVRDSTMPGTVQVVPVQGATLVAVSRDTGSTTTVSLSTNQGEFILGALPYSGLYDLRVSHQDDENGSDEYQFDSAFDCANERCVWGLSMGENLELNIRSIVGERHVARFGLVGPGEARPDWSGTYATLEGDFPWGRIRLTRPVSAAGEIRFPVPEGHYDLTVVPPDDFPLATHRTSLDIKPDGPDAREIAVPARTSAMVRVVSADGEPLADTLVEFQDLAASSRTLSQTTDEEGRIQLPLDLNDYWVTITPNIASLPPTVRFISAGVLAEEQSVKLTTADPVALVGDVLGAADAEDADWLPITDVAIQPFEMVAGRPMNIGEATTREDGGFKMLISSESPSPTP